MASLQTGAECAIKVNQQQIRHTVSSVELQQFIDGHHVLKVRILESRMSARAGVFEGISDYTGFLGAPISISLQSSGGVVDAAEALEFDGLVTKVHLENSIDSVEQVVIEAHSPTIIMDQNRTKRFFLEQTPSDIVRLVTGQYQVTVDSIPSDLGSSSPFTVQYLETDYELTRRYGTQAGYFVFYDGKKLRMAKATGSNAVSLRFRVNLGSFTAGLGTAALGFEAYAWNYNEKKLVSSEKPPSQAPSPAGIAAASSRASKGTFVSSALGGIRSANDMSTVDKHLETEQAAALARMISCTGESIVPSISVGQAVSIESMGELDGQYYVTCVSHNLDDSGKYSNKFTCIPMDVAHPQKYSRPRSAEIENAVVTDTNDPEGLGRVKVFFPWQAEDTGWLRLLVLHAGDSRGWFVVPEIDDEVLVAFEHGNFNRPFVLGSVWNGTDMPPAESQSDANDVKMFQTRGGHLLLFDDKDGSETLKLMQKDGQNSLVMELGGPSISIESEGDITIKGKTISLETTSGDVKINSGGKSSIEASGDLELKGGMNFKAEGAVNAEIKAGAQAKLEGGAMVEIKGAIVKIN